MTGLALALLGAYVAGSVNVAIVVLRALGKGDPREAGSGNAGTTNVYRVAGAAIAGLVLVLDLGRAAGLAWLAARLFPPTVVPWLGFALLVGNRFPCFHGFRGGKGVAALLGFVAPLAWPWALAACGVWLVTRAAIRVSVAPSFAMVAVLAAGVEMAGQGSVSATLAALAIAALIVAAHAPNVAALVAARRASRRR